MQIFIQLQKRSRFGKVPFGPKFEEKVVQKDLWWFWNSILSTSMDSIGFYSPPHEVASSRYYVIYPQSCVRPSVRPSVP